jgi:acyl carrier protein
MSLIDLISAIRPEFDFRQSKDFFGDGLLDSLELITLVSDIERTYGIRIDGMAIVPENFCNLEAIERLLGDAGVRP